MLYRYILTLFLFDISPGLSFAIVAKNTNISFKAGIITALGVALSDFLSGLLVLIGFHTFLTANPKIFFYLRALAICYLAYLALKMFNSKSTEIKLFDKEDKNIKNIQTAKSSYKKMFYEGFIFTFSNLGVIISIASILFQFISPSSSIFIKSSYLLLIPTVSFISFATVALLFANKYTRPFLQKHNNIIDKISGTIILYLVIIQAKEILPLIKK
jgi:threonine/homoserine/homoserine lactone efflux protein